ncbi:hypothetical protein [Oscillibacter sp.]|uniref:hypothetical protein n=1 Tax=Oscillibacter sp. TaxID=1945593 RepID=UPI0028A2AF93|nr:hypothetical protein [Oscillibacter sp.]
MTRKNPFLLFLSACIPGCGQMYQGYMKRGLSLMSLFAVIIGLATWLYFGQLALALPVLWLYSFFDTYNLSRALQNDEAEPDAYPLGISLMDGEQFSRLLAKRHSLVGWVLVLAGLYGMWQMVAYSFSTLLSDLLGFDFYWLASTKLPQLILFLLIIALGVWFIRGPKPRPEDDGFTGFTPPCDAAEGKAAPNPAAASDNAEGRAPEYRAVSDEVSRILRHEKAAGAEVGKSAPWESGIDKEERRDSIEEEDTHNDGK